MLKAAGSSVRFVTPMKSVVPTTSKLTLASSCEAGVSSLLRSLTWMVVAVAGSANAVLSAATPSKTTSRRSRAAALQILSRTPAAVCCVHGHGIGTRV